MCILVLQLSEFFLAVIPPVGICLRKKNSLRYPDPSLFNFTVLPTCMIFLAALGYVALSVCKMLFFRCYSLRPCGLTSLVTSRLQLRVVCTTLLYDLLVSVHCSMIHKTSKIRLSLEVKKTHL